jgi:hypothetical protein
MHGSPLMPSNVIRSFTYEADQGRLVIEFQSGRCYEYFNVPPSVYAGLRNASSRGSYFNAWVRDRYSYSRVH